MTRLPLFDQISQIPALIVSYVIKHKIFVTVSLVVLIGIIGFGVLSIRLRNQLLSQLKTNGKSTPSEIYLATGSGLPNTALDIPSPPDDSKVNIPDDSGANGIDYTIPPSPTPFPLPTYTAPTPLPTNAPVITSTATSCAGTPTEANSQIYVSAKSTTVNNTVTISVELHDCNNSFAPVNDNLTITLSNSDSGARINGNTFPANIQTQNGKSAFSVTSSNAGTDTFVVTDTNRSFTVTMPGYHNPSVTFGNNSSGNSNCTTATGTPNSWYSDVYPASPVSADVGSSATFTIIIRDCDKNTISTSDSITITLTSGDPTTRINGNNPSYTVTTQNGQATFTVTSENAGTNALTVQDTTSGFGITDPNNHNPSVVFNAVSNTSTPAPTDTPTPTPGSTTDTPTPDNTSTPTPTSSTTPTGTPNPNPI